MKAIICPRYGGPEVLSYQDIPKPQPNDQQVLIQVKAATVTAGDCELRRFQITPLFWLPVRLLLGVFRPQKGAAILGQEYAGVVVAVGKEVHEFQPGDKVFGLAGLGAGAYAEYRLESKLSMMALKPAKISFAEAATIPTGGFNALHFLRMAKVQAGEHVLINGAGGSIGTYGIRLAKNYGAEVTAVDSADKLPALKEMGADHVIDYRQEDYRNNGQQYDVIFDVVGQNWSSARLSSLKEGGRYVGANPTFSMLMRSLWNWMTGQKKTVRTGLAGETKQDFSQLGQLAEAGKLKPLIDRSYSLEEVAQAHTYVDEGRKLGNVIVDIAGADDR